MRQLLNGELAGLFVSRHRSRLLRITNLRSGPGSRKRRATRLVDRDAHPPWGSLFGLARLLRRLATQSSHIAIHPADVLDAVAFEEPPQKPLSQLCRRSVRS